MVLTDNSAGTEIEKQLKKWSKVVSECNTNVKSKVKSEVVSDCNTNAMVRDIYLIKKKCQISAKKCQRAWNGGGVNVDSTHSERNSCVFQCCSPPL